MKKQHRRILAAILIVLGALVLWLAPDTYLGAGIALVGIIIEIIGISLERRGNDKPKADRS